MFIKENSTIDIVIYYKKVRMHYLSHSEDEFKNSTMEEEEKSKFKKLSVQMKQLTWGLYNELQEGAIDVDPDGNRRFNYKKYKELRLTKLVAGWDATTKDENGNETPVKVSEKAIKSLAPEIAESILNTYDQVMYLSEEEEKK